MLDLIGGLLALSFLTTVCGTVHGPVVPPRATAVYLGCFALLSVLGTFGVVPSDLLLLQVALPEGGLSDQLQPWQLLSTFFWADGLGAGFALQLWVFTIYSSELERSHFAGAALRYGATLGAGAAIILIQCFALHSSEPLALAHALTFFVVGLASRLEPQKTIRAPKNRIPRTSAIRGPSLRALAEPRPWRDYASIVMNPADEHLPGTGAPAAHLRAPLPQGS